MKAYLLTLTLLVSLLIGCIGKSKVNYRTATISTQPLNLSELNTSANDYNSAGPPMLPAFMPLFFSSDRNYKGTDPNASFNQSSVDRYELPSKGKYDVVGFNAALWFNQNDGNWRWDISPTVRAASQFNKANFAYGLLQRINTPANELGPYIHFTDRSSSNLAMYASDSTGNLDIYFLAYSSTCVDCSMPFPGADRLAATRINSPKDDAYPTLTADRSGLLFTSNRGGSFDLFWIDVSGRPMSDALRSGDAPRLVNVLNSPADDKCPYINGSLLVFTSNRPGGFGGFDLYYSQFRDGRWTTPTNFGPTINTAADEYRPVPFQAEAFENDLMIFSSDRPGGKGGFDLYYVGIPKNLTKP